MHSAEATAPRTYRKVLAALLGFTVITVLAAGVNFGSPSVNVVIALGIATAKGSLVALYFMHLRHDKPMSGVIFLSGLITLAVFLTLCLLDTGARGLVRPELAVPPAPAAAQAR